MILESYDTILILCQTVRSNKILSLSYLKYPDQDVALHRHIKAWGKSSRKSWGLSGHLKPFQVLSCIEKVSIT